MILIINLLCAAVLVLLLHRHRDTVRIRSLTDAINDFLLSGEKIPISTDDGDLGHLQNNIYELQNRLLQERDSTRQEAQNNRAFLSDISHQLKTPLAALRLYCEMDETSHTEKELALIGKMEKLIQNVLTLEKLRSDTYEMDFQLCDVRALCDSLLWELQPLFPGKRFTVTGEGSLRADVDWLHEALLNVVKNACEHTPENGKVDIQLAQTEKSLSITVSDNGGGVNGEDLPKLFCRFHRAENAVPTSAGIGLAITKAVVDKHHGIISAQNGREGLSVNICLPILDGNLKI